MDICILLLLHLVIQKDSRVLDNNIFASSATGTREKHNVQSQKNNNCEFLRSLDIYTIQRIEPSTTPQPIFLARAARFFYF